jgi:two-component system phosphate regulon sensor histidine kinase PhoR
MNKTLLKIGAVLLVIFLLPAVYFSVHQINSLNKNELIIEEIYNNQLDAILFSINQYSADVLNAWAAEVDILLESEGKLSSAQLNRFFLEKPDIQYLFLVDSSNYNKVLLYTAESGQAIDDSLAAKISRTFRNRKEMIDRLYNYLDNGYRKIEPLNATSDESLKMQIFLPGASVPASFICGFILNPETFIQGVLGPKIQAVTQEKFLITVFRDADSYQVYTSATGNGEAERQLHQLPFWLFPDYHLSIDLNGKTIEALAQDRVQNDLYLIIGLNIIILLGVWFVFRNIKREIELAQIKSDFVSNVSHEIRTPLSLISMFAETLMMDRVRSESRKHEYYKIISQETSRLTAMVNKILNFSKMEAGKRTYNLRQLDLNKVVQEVVEAYEYHVTQQGFTYYFEPHPSELIISGDDEAITEALINLLDNAVKYSIDHKSISLKTGQEDGYHFVEIMDRGAGISDANQKAIFEKFFRVPQGDVHNTKGTGLGLSLVKHIMHAHKGKIILESTLGEGSIFRLCFPVKYRVAKLVTSK